MTKPLPRSPVAVVSDFCAVPQQRPPLTVMRASAQKISSPVPYVTKTSLQFPLKPALPKNKKSGSRVSGIEHILPPTHCCCHPYISDCCYCCYCCWCCCDLVQFHRQHALITAPLRVWTPKPAPHSTPRCTRLVTWLPRPLPEALLLLLLRRRQSRPEEGSGLFRRTRSSCGTARCSKWSSGTGRTSS